MSLSIAALRLCTVKALDGATTACGRVFDSVIDPRDLLGENALPTIVVYTDTGRRIVKGRDLLAGDSSVELVIELFVAKATKVKGTKGEDVFEIEYPATDAGYENRLRRLAYEIDTTLAGSTGIWADLWRQCVSRFSERESEWDRGADSKGGARFNYLRIVLRIDPIADPVRGAALDEFGFWSKFLNAADQDNELSDLAKDWRSLMTTPDLPSWRVAAASLGLTHDELQSIGLAPLEDHPATETDEAADLEQATIDAPGNVEIVIEPPEV